MDFEPEYKRLGNSVGKKYTRFCCTMYRFSYHYDRWQRRTRQGFPVIKLKGICWRIIKYLHSYTLSRDHRIPFCSTLTATHVRFSVFQNYATPMTLPQADGSMLGRPIKTGNSSMTGHHSSSYKKNKSTSMTVLNFEDEDGETLLVALTSKSHKDTRR